MGSKATLTYSVLAIVILATLYFWHRAFDGLTLVLETGGGLGGVFIRIIIFMVISIVALQILRGILMHPADENDIDDIEEDERDHQIEARGDRLGYYVLCGFLTILLLQYCLADMYPDRWWNVLNLDRPIEWAVAIVLAMLISEIAKWAAMAIQYRF